MDTDSKVCRVYGLRSSSDDRIRYIGQTTASLSKRLAQHLAAANKAGAETPVHRWIRKALKQGHQINICLVEDECDLHTSEIKWIGVYRARYSDLLNISLGGDGAPGVKRSEETKELMRKPKSLSHKQSMRKPKSDETKKKMSLAQMGNTKSTGVNNRHAKLVEADVIKIRRQLADGKSCTLLASEYGLKKSAISKIKTRRTWKHI